MPLNGTLEIAVITEHYRGNSTAGKIKRNGDPIYVTNGGQALFAGINEVLVRTDSTNFKKPINLETTAQTGCFISSDIPKNMQGLDPYSYILVGVLPWQGYWPNMAEINLSFDPGRIGRAPYFLKNGESSWINYKGPLPNADSYQGAIEKHLNLDPLNHSRVILVESKSQLRKLSSAIKEKGLVPIVMEPLTSVGIQMMEQPSALKTVVRWIASLKGKISY